MSLDAYHEERPLPLVALVGCVPFHAALISRTHAAEELHARYLSLKEDTNVLDHSPGGGENNVVLKPNWMHKHTQVVAAVLALWFTWEADTPTASILAAIEGFRQRCRSGIKIVLVLVQRSGAALTGAFGPLSSPPQVKDDERLSALKKQADLESKQILTLSHVEGEGETARFDEASVKRLERALLELALTYYKDESRNNRKMRQLSSKSAPPHLVARHHFKRAYFSEVRRDAPSAAKHWTACAQALRDLLKIVANPPSEAERSPVRLGEVKRIAEFVNRKMATAAFAGLRAAEACDAFRRHVRLFRSLTQLSLIHI